MTYDLYGKTWERLQEFTCEKIYGGHGKPNCIGFTVQLETKKILLGYDQFEYPRLVLVRAVAALIAPAVARACRRTRRSRPSSRRTGDNICHHAGGALHGAKVRQRRQEILDAT